MNKKILLTTLLLISFSTSAWAEEEKFPFSFEPEVKAKNFGFSIFYSDNFTSDNKKSAIEYRAEVKAHFLDKFGFGPIGEVLFQHQSGTNPAILSGLVPAGDTAHSHDGSALLGYRFGLGENFGFYPFVRGRALITRGRGGDNFYGAEFGGGLEWKIYPETTHLNLKYGVMMPFFHNYTGSPDTVSASSFLLNNIELKLNYRFLPNCDLITAYQIRQFPKNLGSSGLTSNETFGWNGVLLGLGYVF